MEGPGLGDGDAHEEAITPRNVWERGAEIEGAGHGGSCSSGQLPVKATASPQAAFFDAGPGRGAFCPPLRVFARAGAALPGKAGVVTKTNAAHRADARRARSTRAAP